MQFWHPILKAETKPKRPSRFAVAMKTSHESVPKTVSWKKIKKSEFLLTLLHTGWTSFFFTYFSRCTLPGSYTLLLENLFWAHPSVYSGFDKRASFYLHLPWAGRKILLPICSCASILLTTLQSMMNAKLSKQRFWHCYENGLFKTIQTIPHNLYVSV